MTWQEGAIAGGVAGATIGLAFDGPGALVLGLIGAGVGGIVGWLMPGASGGGNSAEQAMRTYYANSIIQNTSLGLNWSHTNAWNVMEVLPATQLYLARKAQWAALQLYDEQTTAGTAHNYNASYVLSKSEVANATLSNLWQVIENYNTVLNSYTDLSQQFTGTYQSMTWGVNTPTGSENFGVTAISGQYARMQFVTSVPIGTTPTYYDVSNKVPLEIVNRALAQSDFILHIQTGDGHFANVSVSMPSQGMQSINLDSLGLKSGRMSFTATGAIADICGIIGSDPLTSAKAIPALLVTQKSGSSEIFLSETLVDGLTVTVRPYWNTVYTATDLPSIRVNDGNSNIAVKITRAFSDMAAASLESKNLTSVANSYGQTFYNQVVAAGGNVPTPWSDIVFPDPNQLVNLSPEQLTALYYSYLLKMRDWFNDSTILTPGDINITVESANLLVRGEVVNPAGKVIVYNTTVWTPYLMLSDVELKLGWNNITQPGFVETWYDAATIDPDATNTFKNFTYVEIGTGWRLHIDEIYYQGNAVPSVNLTVDTWDFIINNGGSSTAPPQAQTDLEWIIAHWYYIAAIAAVVVLLGAVAVRNGPLAIIGVILLLAAAVGWYLSGDHSLLSWAGLAINLWGK